MSTAPVILRPYRALQYTPTTTINGVTVTRVTNSTVNGAPVTRAQSAAIVADATIEEEHTDEMVVTDNPVEQNSTVSDHAYKLPAELRLRYTWALGSPQNTANDVSFLNSLYSQLLCLQANRTLFQIFTGKRAYSAMLIKSIGVTTDKETENVLSLSLGLREVIIVSTSVITVNPKNMQAQPQLTGAPTPQGGLQLQPGTKYNPGGS